MTGSRIGPRTPRASSWRDRPCSGQSPSSPSRARLQDSSRAPCRPRTGSSSRPPGWLWTAWIRRYPRAAGATATSPATTAARLSIRSPRCHARRFVTSLQIAVSTSPPCSSATWTRRGAPVVGSADDDRYVGVECGAGCVEIELSIDDGPGALRVPVPTGHRLVDQSLLLEGRSIRPASTSLGEPLITPRLPHPGPAALSHEPGLRERRGRSRVPRRSRTSRRALPRAAREPARRPGPQGHAMGRRVDSLLVERGDPGGIGELRGARAGGG